MPRLAVLLSLPELGYILDIDYITTLLVSV